MDRRIAGWLAWSTWTLAIVLTVLGLVLLGLSWTTPVPDSWGFRGFPSLLSVTFASVGAVVAARRPANPIGWIFLGTGLSFGVQSWATSYGVFALITRPGLLPGGLVAGWITSWIWAPTVDLSVVLLFVLFPDGRLPSPRWRPVIWLTAAAAVLMSVGLVFRPGPLMNAPYASNPLGIPGAEALFLVFVVGSVLACISAAAAAACLLRRLRRARGDERAQLKWIAFASAAVAVALATGTFFASFKPTNVFLILALTSVPLSAGIAILKYRLYAIDVLIRRTLVYGALTACLALVYYVAVFVFQGLLRALTGQSADVVVVGSTLAMAALFQPVRRRMHVVIDRQFYRQKYDAARVLAAFAESARNETDLERLTAEMQRVVTETMHPVHVSVWLRPVESKMK